MTVTAFMIPGCLRCNKENVPIRITYLIGEFILITYVEISFETQSLHPRLRPKFDPWNGDVVGESEDTVQN